MCKKIMIALVGLALPAMVWADTQVSIPGSVNLPILPGFGLGSTSHSADVQVSGFSSSDGSNIANLNVASTQLSYHGTEGDNQETQSNTSVDYSGNGTFQVNEGGSILPILPVAPPVLLGLGNGMSVGLGLGGPSLGTIGLNNMLNSNLLGLGQHVSMPMIIGQPGMPQIIVLP